MIKLKQYKPNVRLRGAFVGMPMADYLSAPGLNSSSIKLLLESPLQFKRKADGLLLDRPTAATELGTALHSAILEGRFDCHIRPETYGEGKPWNGNATACKEWYAAHADKPVFSEAEANLIVESFQYVRDHRDVVANRLLAGGAPEVSMFAEIDGRLFKCRADYYRPGSICDLKSVTDASKRGFARAVTDFCWHIQAAININVARALGDASATFTWLALQKGQLPLLNVVRASQAWLNAGNAAIDGAIDLQFKCQSNNEWPEWSDYDGTTKIHDLPIPQWVMDKIPEQDLSSGSLSPDQL